MSALTRPLSILIVSLSIAALCQSVAQAETERRNAMHAVLVTYENDTPADKLQNHPDNVGYAKALKNVSGLISKTWINDGKTLGGFHVFTSKGEAEAFVNSDMFQSAVVKEPSNRNVQVRHFAVFSELTIMSGGPSKTLNAP